MTGAQRLADEAFERLFAHIRAGGLGPDGRVHERQIAEALTLSRTPLREALLRLEGAGILIRDGRAGLRLAAIGVARYIEILHMRRLLEAEAARLAAGRIPPAALAPLRERMADDSSATTVDVARALARLCAGSCGNETMLALLEHLWWQADLFGFEGGLAPDEGVVLWADELLMCLETAAGAGRAAALVEARFAKLRRAALDHYMPG